MNLIFDPSLVLYLPLYERGGTSLISKDAYGHVCAVTGALWRPDGRYFDGTDDKIVVPTHSALDGLTDFTFAAWASFPAIGSEDTFIFDDDDTGNKFQLWRYDAKIRIYLFGTAYDGTGDVTGGWHYVAAVRSSSDLHHYVDGSLDKTNNSVSTNALPTGSDWLIGHYKGGGFTIDGKIGECRIYSRALSSLEILNIYLSTKWRYQ